MTLRDDVLPIVNVGRQIVDDLGFRQFTCEIVTRTWSTGKIRSGTFTDSAQTISPNPKLVERDGGKTLVIGPLTPRYTIGAGGGYTPETLRPADVAGVEVFWRVTGPFSSGYASVRAVVTDIDTGKPLRYMVTLTVRERENPL